MRNPVEIIYLAISATVTTMGNMAELYQKKGWGEQVDNQIDSEAQVVDTLAIKLNVSNQHKFPIWCMKNGIALDLDVAADGNAVLDIKWSKMPKFLESLDEAKEVDVLMIS